MCRRIALFLAIAMFLAPAAALTDTTKWTETATMKTKSIYDDAGKLVYQANWDKQTNRQIGSVLDIRPKTAPPKAKARGTSSDEASFARPIFRSSTAGTWLVADSLVKIQILDNLSTRKRPKTPMRNFVNQRNQRFRYKVRKSLKFRGRTVVPTGTMGHGFIKSLRRRGRFGRSGKLNLSFGHIQTPGKRSVHLVVSKKAAEFNKKQGHAIGASFGGLLVLGPIGILGGIGVKGRDVFIPAGTSLWVAVERDVNLSGELH